MTDARRPPTATRATSPVAAMTVAFLVLFLDMLVYGLAVPVLPRLAASAEAGVGAIGALFACYAAGFLVATPIAGRWVDRVGQRTPLLTGVLGLAAATLVFGLSEGFWTLVLARLLQGASAGFSWVAALALIAGTTSMEKRGQAMGIAISGMTAGLLLGPPVGGVLADAFEPSVPFLFATGFALVAAAVYLLLVRPTPPATDDPAGPLTVLRVPGTGAVITIALLSAGAIAVIEPLLPLRLSAEFDAASATIGGLFAITVLVGALLSPVAGTLIGRVPVAALVAVGAGLAAAAFVVLAVATRMWHVAAAMALLGVAYGPLLQTPASTLMGVQGQRSRPPALGASYALYNLAFGGGLLVGPLLGSVPAQVTGFAPALVGAAVVIALAGAVAAPRLPAFPSSGGDSGARSRSDA